MRQEADILKWNPAQKSDRGEEEGETQNPKSKVLSDENGNPTGRRKREIQSNRKMILDRTWVFVSLLHIDTNPLFRRKFLLP